MLKNDLKNDIEKTLQAHCPEPPEGFAERMDNKAISLIQKKHNQNVNKGRSRFRLPVLVTAAMLALCFVTAATRDLINRPDEIRARETTTPLVTTLSEGKGEVTEGAGLSQEAIKTLEETYPGLINELKPVNLSNEQQGVRFDLVSAVIKNRDFYIVYSIQDLEGDRVKANLSTDYHDHFGANDHPQEIMRLNYDEAEHKGEYVRKYTMPEAIHTTGEVVAMSFQDLWTSEHCCTVDLLPLLEQYGKTVKSVALPEDLNIQPYDPRDTSTNYSCVLDYTQPLDETLYGPVKLTGIGWIDNKLHVQVYNQDTSVISIGRDYSPSWKIWLGSHITDQEGKRFVDYNTLSWGYSDEKEPVWHEYVWDISPDEKSQMDLSVAVEHITKTLEAKWEFQVPVDSIVAGNSVKPSANIQNESDKQIEATLWGFFIDWVAQDTESLLAVCADEWKNGQPDPKQAAQTIMAYGQPGGYIINGISGKDNDPVRTVDLTVQWKTEDGGYTYNRHEIACKLQKITPAMEAYQIDPTGFDTGIDVETVPDKELVLLTEEEIIRKAISYPDLSYDDFIPLNLSVEKQGIRMEVISGCVKGQELYILCSVQELEGRYVGLDMEIDQLFKPEVLRMGYSRPYSNYAENKSFWLFHTDEFAQYQAEDGTIPFGIDLVKFENDISVDLIPFLEKYGKESEGVNAPENARAFGDKESVEGLKILDYTNPLDVSLAETATLTGIGWIDNQLHVQMHTATDNIHTESGTSFPATSVHVYDPFSSQSGQVVEWDENGDWFPEWCDYALDIKPENIEQQWLIAEVRETKGVVEVDWEIPIPVNTLQKETGEETALPEGEGDETGDAGLSLEAINMLEAEHPGLIDELKPVNLSSEKQGVRFDLHSALIRNHKMYMLYSIQDLEGNRVKDTLTTSYNDNFGAGDKVQSTLKLNYDEAEHKGTYLREYELPESVKASGTVMMSFEDLGVSELFYMDLNPQLEQYGKPVEKVKLPEDLHVSSSSNLDFISDMYTGVLDYTQPLDETLSGPVKLTGIGWIDNKLHVQIYNPEASVTFIGKNVFSSWMISPGVAVTNREGTEDVDYNTLSWGYTEESEPVWQEYAWDIPSDEKEHLNLRIYLTHLTKLLEAKWEFQVPVDSILSETDADIAAQEEKPAEPATLSNEGEVFLEYAYPGLLNELKPVNLSSVQQGIRADIISALIKDQKLYVVFSLQDLEGDRIKENPVISCLHNLSGGSESTMRLGYNELNEHHRVTYLKTFDLSDPVQAGGRIKLNIDGLDAEKRYEVDLLPLLKKYGKTVEGVNTPKDVWIMPYDLRTSSAVDASKYPTILDYEHPLDETLKGTISLTGIGWIDNRLHVQIHNTDNTAIIFGGTIYPSTWMISPRCAVMDGKDYGYDTLSWDSVGGWQAAWQEYVWEITPDDTDHLELKADVTHFENILDAQWNFELPVDSILADTEAKPAAHEAEAEKAQESILLDENVQKLLTAEWHEIANELKPVNLSCEKQGIRMDVYAALVKGNKSWFIFSLEDLEGDRITAETKSYVDLFHISGYQDINSVSWHPLELDDEKHRITVATCMEYSGSYQPEDNDFIVQFKGIGIPQHRRIDLLPYLAEYGKTAESVEASTEVVSAYSTGKVGESLTRKGMKILDYTRPLDVELGEDLYLTGIGWIDNQLHVQIHDRQERAVVIGGMYHKPLDCNVEGAYAQGKYGKLHEVDQVYWHDGDTEQREYVFNCSEGRVDNLELYADITEIVDVVRDNWEVRVPLEEVLAEGENAAAQETAAPAV